MALPVTITGLQANRRIVGPFKSSAGNYYLFGQNATTATTLTAMKATAPDVSWSSVATKTGFAGDVQGLGAYQAADVIHMIVGDVTTAGTSYNYKYQTFNMATDTFVTAETIVSAINPTDSGAGVYGLCEIIFRPFDSQPVALYPGPRVSTRAKVNYKVRTGTATWSAAVVVDAAAANTDYYPIGIALGASSTIHFEVLGLGTTPSAVARSLTSANVLQTASNLPANYGRNGGGKGTSLVNGATTKAAFFNNNSSTNNGIVGYFDSGNTPTVNTSGAVGASGLMNAGSGRIVSSGTDFWAIYSRSDTGDVYASRSTDSGATWSAETLVMAATNASSGPNGDEWLSFNGTAYTRGGNTVIGFVVNDAGVLKYNEVALSASASTGTLSATLDALTVAATGKVPSQGTSAVTLGAASLLAAGKVPAQGTLAVTLDMVVAAGGGTVGSLPATGSLSVTLAPLTLVGAGKVLAQVTLGQTLGALALAGQGIVPAVGRLGIIFDRLTLDALAVVPNGARLDATLDAMLLNGRGRATVSISPPPSVCIAATLQNQVELGAVLRSNVMQATSGMTVPLAATFTGTVPLRALRQTYQVIPSWPISRCSPGTQRFSSSVLPTRKARPWTSRAQSSAGSLPRASRARP